MQAGMVHESIANLVVEKDMQGNSAYPVICLLTVLSLRRVATLDL